MNKKQRNKIRKKRIRKEIVTQMHEIAFPDMPKELVGYAMSPDNPYTRNGMEGKWIDGSPMTPDKIALLPEIFEKVFLDGQSEEVQKEILKRLDDINQINRELNPNIKTIYRD